jgi:hypothetical protein
MADHEQIAMQYAHTSLIAVETYGDDQIYLIAFLRSVSEAATSSEEILRRLREVRLVNVIVKKNVTNNSTIFLANRQLLTANGVPVHRATCSIVKFISLTPCHIRDRIGPLYYTHWVCLSVTDLAGKYDIVTGEGFPHRGFSLSPPF